MLKPIPLFGLGNVGKSVNVNAQERLNLYVEIQTDPETNTVALYGTPGLVADANLGANPNRGLYQKGDFRYLVNRDTLWQLANDGTLTNRGTLLTTGGRVDITDNGTQMIIVDGTYGYIYNFTTFAFTQITDIDYPASQTTTFLNSYFINQRTDTAEFYISSPLDGFTWDSLDFATAESDPDRLVRVIANNGQLVLFGEKSTEFWGDSGAADFPFARVGASGVEWGLAARWSLCKFSDSALIFLGKNRLGQVQVFMMSGYTPVAVSNPELDYTISQYSAFSDASGFAYMLSGHPFYQINFPSANDGDGESWLYDGLSNAWSRVGQDEARHRAEIQINHQDQSYVSDFENGKLYLLDENTYTDDGATIPRQLITRHQATGDYSRISQLWLQFEAGVGLPPTTAPVLPALTAGYYDSDVYDNLFSFARASTATYIDALGVVQTAAVDVARYEDNELLIEDAATNLLTYSEEFDNAAWIGIDVTIGADAAVAPDGATTADSMVSDAGDIGYTTQSVSYTAGTTYTQSVFIEPSGKTSFLLLAEAALFADAVPRFAMFTLTGAGVAVVSGSGATASIELFGSYYRISITFTPTLSVSSGNQFRDGTAGDGVSGFNVWGAQIEEGALSSYIPTVASTVTRAADIAFTAQTVDAVGTDPQVMMQISRDGGHEWGGELWRSMGRMGRYRHRAVWNRLGRARDWLFKFRITDPIKVVMVAAWGEYGR